MSNEKMVIIGLPTGSLLVRPDGLEGLYLKGDNTFIMTNRGNISDKEAIMFEGSEEYNNFLLPFISKESNSLSLKEGVDYIVPEEVGAYLKMERSMKQLKEQKDTEDEVYFKVQLKKGNPNSYLNSLYFQPDKLSSLFFSNKGHVMGRYQTIFSLDEYNNILKMVREDIPWWSRSRLRQLPKYKKGDPHFILSTLPKHIFPD